MNKLSDDQIIKWSKYQMIKLSEWSNYQYDQIIGMIKLLDDQI